MYGSYSMISPKPVQTTETKLCEKKKHGDFLKLRTNTLPLLHDIENLGYRIRHYLK